MGTYSPSFHGATTCLPCQMGSYCPISGLTAARPCVAGSFSANPGASACSICPLGTWGAANGATSPTCNGTCCFTGYSCPAGSTSPSALSCPSDLSSTCAQLGATCGFALDACNNCTMACSTDDLQVSCSPPLLMGSSFSSTPDLLSLELRFDKSLQLFGNKHLPFAFMSCTNHIVLFPSNNSYLGPTNCSLQALPELFLSFGFSIVSTKSNNFPPIYTCMAVTSSIAILNFTTMRIEIPTTLFVPNDHCKLSLDRVCSAGGLGFPAACTGIDSSSLLIFNNISTSARPVTSSMLNMT